MLDGNGDLKGKAVRRLQVAGCTTWETYEAYVMTANGPELVGTADDSWSAYSKIEMWYAMSGPYTIVELDRV